MNTNDQHHSQYTCAIVKTAVVSELSLIVHLFIYLFIYSYFCSYFFDPSIHSFIHSSIHSLILSFIHLNTSIYVFVNVPPKGRKGARNRTQILVFRVHTGVYSH